MPEKNVKEAPARALDDAMVEAPDEKGRGVTLGKVYSIFVPVTWDGAVQPIYAAIESLSPEIVGGPWNISWSFWDSAGTMW